MALKKSPRGLIRPYTREGVTSSLKKTAKDSALMRSGTKLLEKQVRVKPVNVEAAEDVLVDVELLAIQVASAAKSAQKELRKVTKKVEKYLAETSE